MDGALKTWCVPASSPWPAAIEGGALCSIVVGRSHRLFCVGGYTESFEEPDEELELSESDGSEPLPEDSFQVFTMDVPFDTLDSDATTMQMMLSHAVAAIRSDGSSVSPLDGVSVVQTPHAFWVVHALSLESYQPIQGCIRIPLHPLVEGAIPHAVVVSDVEREFISVHGKTPPAARQPPVSAAMTVGWSLLPSEGEGGLTQAFPHISSWTLACSVGGVKDAAGGRTSDSNTRLQPVSIDLLVDYAPRDECSGETSGVCVGGRMSVIDPSALSLQERVGAAVGVLRQSVDWDRDEAVNSVAGSVGSKGQLWRCRTRAEVVVVGGAQAVGADLNTVPATSFCVILSIDVSLSIQASETTQRNAWRSFEGTCFGFAVRGTGMVCPPSKYCGEAPRAPTDRKFTALPDTLIPAVRNGCTGVVIKRARGVRRGSIGCVGVTTVPDCGTKEFASPPHTDRVPGISSSGGVDFASSGPSGSESAASSVEFLFCGGGANDVFPPGAAYSNDVWVAHISLPPNSNYACADAQAGGAGMDYSRVSEGVVVEYERAGVLPMGGWESSSTVSRDASSPPQPALYLPMSCLLERSDATVDPVVVVCGGTRRNPPISWDFATLRLLSRSVVASPHPALLGGSFNPGSFESPSVEVPLPGSQSLPFEDAGDPAHRGQVFISPTVM